jgi:hypothetical protein
MCFDDSLRLHSHQSLLLQYTELKFPGVSHFVNKKWLRIYVFERVKWIQSATEYHILEYILWCSEISRDRIYVEFKDGISCGIYRDHIPKQTDLRQSGPLC